MTAPAIIYSSDNGLTWTATTSPFDDFGTVCGIAYNGSIFVAVGAKYLYTVESSYQAPYTNFPCIATSSDGITWTERISSFATQNFIFGVVWNGACFVSNLGFGNLEYSSDGITWAQCTVPAINVGADYLAPRITVNGPTVVVSYSAYPGYAPSILVSTDGITFTDEGNVASFYDNGQLNIVYGGGTYLISTFNNIYTSPTPTGGTWADYGFAGFPRNDVGIMAAYANAQYLTGNGDLLLSSADAVSWSSQTISAFTGKTMVAATYSGGKYVLVGSTAPNLIGPQSAIIARSADLVTWTPVTTVANAPALYAIASGAGKLVAGGQPNVNFAPPGIPGGLACRSE
jgi:hypothetical protein